VGLVIDFILFMTPSSLPALLPVFPLSIGAANWVPVPVMPLRMTVEERRVL